MSSEEAPPERDVKDFKFQQLCRFRISSSPSDLPKEKSKLVAASSCYGLVFVGYSSGFKVIRPADLSQIDQANARDRMTVIVDIFPVVADVRVPGTVSCISLNADELTLVVVVTNNDLVQAFVYDVRAFSDQQAPVQCFLKIRLTTDAVTRFQDLAWNPVQPTTLVTIKSDGGVSLYDITDKIHIVASVPSAMARCVCWSPRGKQLVVGTTDGKLVQYDQELKKKREWSCPVILTKGTYQVIGVIWLSTYEFLAAYFSDNSEPSDQPDIVLIRGSKDGPNFYQNFEDPCFGNGEERGRIVLFQCLQKWEMLLTCSSNACETSVIGKHPDVQADWERWNLDDSARAELPLTDNHDDTFPMGMAVDYSSQFSIPEGEGSHPPSPILLLLSTDGVLVPYYMMNSHSGATVLTAPPRPLPTTGMRTITGGLVEPDAVSIPSVAASNIGSNSGPSTTSTVFAKGPPTGPSFQFVNSSTAAASNPVSAPFGSPKTTSSSVFGTGTTSVFGSGATFGVSAEPKSSTTGTGATFSFVPQSTESSTTKTATFSFSESLGSQSTASSGFKFGGSSATAPAVAFSFKTPSSGSQPVFGAASTTSAGITTTSSTSGFALNTTPAKSGSTAIFTAPSATSPSTSTAFSFKTASTVPPAPGPGGSNFAMPVQPGATQVQLPGATQVQLSGATQVQLSRATQVQLSGATQVQLSGATQVQLSGATRMEPPPYPTPGVQGQSRQVAGFKGFVTTPQSSTTVSQSTSGFQGFINPTTIAQATEGTATSDSRRSQPMSSLFYGHKVAPVSSSQSIASTPSPSSRPIPTATQLATRPIPTTTQVTVAASRPVMAPPAPVHTSTVSRPVDSEDTFTKGILEELSHFEEEMSEFRAQTCNSGILVGSRSEMQQLRAKVDDLTSFASEIIITTKDQTKEVEDQKALCLDLFAMVEECRVRESRNTDNKYMHLLKARALDPASLDHLRQLQQQYQVLDQGLRDVDAILDQQWTEHQNRDRHRNKVKAPTTDVMYRVLKSNSSLIRNQKSTLSNLERKLKELKLYNKTSAWQHASSSNNDTRDIELSTLADSLLGVSQTPSASSTQTGVKILSPEKQARLREHLARHAVPKIKSTRPENLSTSRIATVDRRRHDLEETIIAQAPGQTFQTKVEKRLVNTAHQTVVKAAPSVGKRQATHTGGQMSSMSGQPTAFQFGQGGSGLSMTGQSGSWDLSRQNMLPPSGTAGVQSKFTVTGPSAIPGGLKKLGDLVVEDITPPSSTGYEEEDDDDDDYDEDDEEEDYLEEDEEEENGVGFGPQYSMSSNEPGGDKGLSAVYTSKNVGFNISQGSANVSKNLFGTSKPATPPLTKPALSSGMPTTATPLVAASFGTKPGEFSFGSTPQSHSSFSFGGNGGGSTFTFGGSAKPLEVRVGDGAATTTATTKAASAFASMSAKRSAVTTTSTSGSITTGDMVESSEKKRNPLLLEALSVEEEVESENPKVSTASPGGEGFSGFSFTKPVQPTSAVTMATVTPKQDSGASQDSDVLFGQTTTVSSGLYRVPSSISMGTSGSTAATTTITMTAATLSTPVSTVASSFTGFGVSSTTGFGQTNMPAADAIGAGAGDGLSVQSIVSSDPVVAPPIFGGKLAATSVTVTRATTTSSTPSTTSTFGDAGAFLGQMTTVGSEVTSILTESVTTTSAVTPGGIFDQPKTSSTSVFGQPAATAEVTAPATGPFSQLTTTSSGGLLGTPSSGDLFGVPATTTSAGGLFSAPATTTSAGGLFGVPAATTSAGGLFSAPATTTSAGDLFGVPATTTSAGGLFSAPATTTSAGGLFGVPAATTSAGGLFGVPAATTSAGGLFGVPATTTSAGGLFGVPAATTSAGGLFGVPATTTSAGGLFGAPAATTSAGGLFGAPATTTSAGGLFGVPAATTSAGGLFGVPAATTSAGGLFGAPATTTSDGGLFGAPATTTSAGGLFGVPATTTSTGGLFGAPLTSTSGSGGTFGAITTTTAAPLFDSSSSATSVFGGTSATTPSSPSLFGCTPDVTTTEPLFGSTTTATPIFGGTSAPSIFGGGPSSTATSGFGGFTSSSFGQSVAFSQPGQTSSLFGQSTTTQAGFGQVPSPSLFGQSSPRAEGQTSTGGGMFSGLGGQPSAEKASTNVFGTSQSFGSPTTTGTASLFGGQKSAGFGTSGAGQASPTGGTFTGGFTGTGVGSSGFGVSQTQGGFGAAPSFGGIPALGSTMGGFGSSPTFGSGSAFGSGATFSNPVAPASPSSSGTGFAGFASSNSPTFGSLAGSPDAPPPFGSLGGDGGFGASPGFGSAPSQGFGSSGTGSSSFGSNPAFSGYR